VWTGLKAVATKRDCDGNNMFTTINKHYNDVYREVWAYMRGSTPSLRDKLIMR